MKKLLLSNFDYALPESRIAQKSCVPRDQSRLMVVDSASETLTHARFCDIKKFLQSGDVLVVNDSKVIPARLAGTKSSGGAVEILLVKKIRTDLWTAMLKNFSAREVGKLITIKGSRILKAEAVRLIENGLWEVRFRANGKSVAQPLQKAGITPIPPYIKNISSLSAYQTVYAAADGSVAAPTAGFHFTRRLIARLKKKGVVFCPVTLHVGPGTFLPIRDEDVSMHQMHPESARLTARAARILNVAKKEGQRIIAVGTTSVRVLESFSDSDGTLASGIRDVNLFITPGYRFKVVDGLVTNFHLPKSTLLLLVCAFAESRQKGGTRRILTAYRDAIKKKYRFYSFGDAMMIL